MERKQKSRIEGPEESQQTNFQGMLAVEDEISEIERELREAGQLVRQVSLEWTGTEAKGLRDMDVARSDVAWMAASGARCSKAEVGPSDVSKVGFDTASSA